MTADGAGPHRRHASRPPRTPAGRLVPAADRRLAPQRAQHQRPARQAAAHQGQGGRHHRRRRQQGRLRHGHRRVHDPGRQPVPARRGRAAGQDPAGDPLDGLPQPVPRSRSTRTTSPTSATTRRTRNAQQRSRGPSGTGRFEIVRKPSNYGWPTCYKRDLAYYKWNFHEFAPNTTTAGTPLQQPAGAARRATARRSATTRCGTSRAARRSSPASSRCRRSPTRTSGTRTATTTPRRRSARRAWRYYAPTPGPIAPGSTTECPRLFPELYTGGVGPHGMTKYNYDPANPNPKKFPPYYDDSVIFGEWTQDTLREVKLDEQNRDATRSTASSTAAAGPTPRPARSCSSATTRWTCSGAPTARSTC